MHCSAGVGRTGTFIALSVLLEIIDDPSACDQSLDIFSTVLELRRQRSQMVSGDDNVDDVGWSGYLIGHLFLG